MLQKARFPNALSWLRIAGSPLGIVAGGLGWTSMFLIWAALSAASDTADGVLARRWNVVSERGRRLDSWGDLACAIAAPVGAMLLWPHVAREWVAMAVLGAAHLVPAIAAVIVRGSMLSYHTVLARASAWLTWPSALALVLGLTPIPFRIAAGVEALVALEYFAIWWLCPTWSGEMRSIVQALRDAWPTQPSTSDRLGGRADLRSINSDRVVVGRDDPVFNPLQGAAVLRRVVGLSAEEVLRIAAPEDGIAELPIGRGTPPGHC